MMRKALVAATICGALAGSALADTIQLTGTVRDFKRGDWSGGHPDFETCNNVAGHGTFGQVIGLVSYQLGSDNKPVYNPTRPSNDSMYSAASFAQWYNDTPGVNMSMPLTISLSNGKSSPGGVYTYSNSAFFPIDGLLLGNQGQLDAYNAVHNFSFTFELHTQFTYVPGQNFSFTGDDDVFVFINGTKVMDLGGVHAACSGNVILFDGKAFIYNGINYPVGGIVQSVTSSIASSEATKWKAAGLSGTCPITSGTIYINLNLANNATVPLDFFFNERHTVCSNFLLSTSIVLQSVPTAVPTPLYD